MGTEDTVNVPLVANDCCPCTPLLDQEPDQIESVFLVKLVMNKASDIEEN